MSATTMKAPTRYRPLLIATAIVLALGADLYFSGNWPRMAAQLVHEPVSSRAGDITIK
jgi:hypothetical protein